MKLLQLKTKEKTLLALKSGEVTEYAREIRPNTQKKYCELDEEGYVKDIDGVLQPRKYDAVEFSCGEERYTCEIEEAWIELLEDNNGKLISYTENGEEYIAAQVVYKLGKSL